eukprot:UC4_evm2s607
MELTLLVVLGFLIGTTLNSWDRCPAGQTGSAPCSDRNQKCSTGSAGPTPQYHLQDREGHCGMNDPNGPFFDPRHNLFHLFFQDHIGRPVPNNFAQGFEGPSWGHTVSADMVRWAHLPVALWNGPEWYNVHALFTGSATVFNGSVTLMFPGVCDMYPPSGTIPGCKYGYTFGLATPANTTDPFLTNWTKDSQNPVVNDTFDDPSSAWITSDGELRWIANCGDGKVGDCGDGNQTPLYGAKNPSFSSAHKIGYTNMDAGECPSLYPLPKLSPGSEPIDNMPTHVHKWGCQPYKDCYDIGNWTDATGVWVSALEDAPIIMDNGSSYAAKDLDDQKSGRRISFAWARLEPDKQGYQINGDVQTIAREVTYHPTLQQLLFSPLEEQASLRQEVLGTAQNKFVSSKQNIDLGPWQYGNQSDILIRFSPPNKPATLYISISASVHIDFFVKFTYTTISSKRPWWNVEVGVLIDNPYHKITDNLRLVKEDQVVELRLLLDHTVVEAYWQSGRVVMTVPVLLTHSTSLTLSCDTAQSHIFVENVTAWKMGSAWVSKEEILASRTVE